MIGAAGESRLAAAALTLALVCGVPAQAHAKPQWNAGLESGGCWNGSSLALRGLDWCNALHADVLFLREHGRDVGIGPSLRLGTAGFDDLRLDTGVSILLPLLESFPLVLEAGPHVRNFKQPGVFASAFFGLRSLNHYGSYEMAAGLAITAERAFTVGTPSALWLTLRVDGSWLALPFLLLKGV